MGIIAFFKNGVLSCFLLLSFFVVNKIAVAEALVIPIEAHIDGRSRLEFTPTSVQWLHLDFAAPGRHAPLELPTIINNEEWYPLWPDVPDKENRDCLCYSGKLSYTAPWTSTDTISLQIIEARENVSIIESPTSQNGGKLVIEFDDDLTGGYAWYRINLVISKNQSDGLVLWNTLGSLDEVLHSRVGPNLELYDRAIHGSGTMGTPGFIPGLFGGALVLDPGELAQIGDRIRNIVLNNAPDYLNTERGTVEAWYRQDKDPVPYERNPYRIFDGAHGLNQCFIFHSLATDAAPDDPRLEMGFSGNCGGNRIAVSAPISQYNGHWIHIAGVWDRLGINGTNETIRLYVNGVKLSSTTDNTWGDKLGKVVEIAGSNDIDPYRAFAVDNIALWDSAHDAFSLKEDPRIERNIQVPIAIGSRHLSKHRIEKGCGIVEVIVLGTESINVEHISPTTIHWVGKAPFDYYFKDKAEPLTTESLDFSCDPNRNRSCQSDGNMDLVLRFRLRDIRESLEPGVGEGCRKVEIEGSFLPQYGPIKFTGITGLLVK